MSRLFEPLTIGTLTLRNRMMRSATAERMVDPETNAPQPRLGGMYRALAEGGVGLIVTGHAYIARGGKAHPEMASIANDAMIPAWRDVIRPAQDRGARVMLQINHAGSNCDPVVALEALSPSGVSPDERTASRPMSTGEIDATIEAYGSAARRAREAGFDGVQIHGAHGYLVSQFLTPHTNRRDDAWGGDAERRRAFLLAVIATVRLQVGPDYPLWIKLGVAGTEFSGLEPQEGAAAAAACLRHGVDCVEISHAIGIPDDIQKNDEANFLPWARIVRDVVGNDGPLALVYGFRTRSAMNGALDGGLVQIVSLCRPLILEPDLPNRLRSGTADAARCVRCGRCWPETPGQGVGCHNPRMQE